VRLGQTCSSQSTADLSVMPTSSGWKILRNAILVLRKMTGTSKERRPSGTMRNVSR